MYTACASHVHCTYTLQCTYTLSSVSVLSSAVTLAPGSATEKAYSIFTSGVAHTQLAAMVPTPAKYCARDRDDEGVSPSAGNPHDWQAVEGRDLGGIFGAPRLAAAQAQLAIGVVSPYKQPATLGSK